jgi:hypothetical protein
MGGKYFDVKYQRGNNEEDVRKLVKFLDEEQKSIIDKLGFESKKHIEVIIYESAGRYLSEANVKKPWRVAYYAKGVLHLQPIGALQADRMMEADISFELSKAQFEPVAAKGCPRWLREAFAVYHSGELENLTPPIGVRISSFADLDQDIQSFPDPPQREDVHYILGHTMAFFIDRYGEPKSDSVFRQFDGTKSVETVFKNVFGENISTIEKAWAKAILSKTSPPKK